MPGIDQILDTILIHQRHAGLGDSIMTTMLHDAVRRAYPGREIVVATPRKTAPIFEGFGTWIEIDQAVPDMHAIHLNFSVVGAFAGGTFQDCDFWNNCMRDIHPAQFIAMRNGLEMETHPRSSLKLTTEELAHGKALIGDPATILIAPTSSTINRNMSAEQINHVCQAVQERGYRPLLIHHRHLPEHGLHEAIHPTSIREMLSVVSAAKAVVSVETSIHHAAGVLGIPCLSLYSFCDGFTYNKYYQRTVNVQDHKGVTLTPSMKRMDKSKIVDGFERLISQEYDSKNKF